MVQEDGRKQPKIKFSGRIFMGHQGPRRRGISDPGMSQTKKLLYAKCAMLCCFRRHDGMFPQFGTGCAHAGLLERLLSGIRKRRGIQKSMGHKVPWKIGMLICHPAASRPLILTQKEAASSPCNFAITLLTACILKFYLP